MGIPTLVRTAVAGALLAAITAAVYEKWLNAELTSRIQSLEQQQAALAEQNRQWQRDRDDAAGQSTELLAENSRLKSAPDRTELLQLRARVAQLGNAEAHNKNDPTERAVEAMVSRINLLKRYLADHPDKNISEFQYLKDRDWLRNAADGWPLQTEDDLKLASGSMRQKAKNYFAYFAAAALANYIADHNGQLPPDVYALKPYFHSPVDDETLRRFELAHTGTLAGLPKDEPILVEKAPVDDQYDTLYKIGAFGYSFQGVGKLQSTGSGGFGTNITAKLQLFVSQ
ncbi:MAG TPA: hypothetical protein VN625_10925 [Desulfuromonadaceae bacterium]|nr:hypothetical protein [Desulfuromonadaceae bacterium]